MFLTNILLKKAKSKMVMVLMESVVSGHQVTRIRERLADKLEYIRFDPYIIIDNRKPEKLTPVLPRYHIVSTAGYHITQLLSCGVQQESLYKERKKIRSIKSS